ncbi:MAG: GNAT family N-acetyltransferase [Azospirillaceae bacterium]|nr:GNAT family N-acetyltransferase [Azospirillaceae bacterium]
MTPIITAPENPTPEDREAILAPLRAYNDAQAGASGFRVVALLLKDEAGATVGGLWGKISYDWLFVELLSVPEALRGHDFGTALMAEAERLARGHGCLGLWLDTFGFQARGFYEKLGFSVFGTLEDHPAGNRRHFLAKRF